MISPTRSASVSPYLEPWYWPIFYLLSALSTLTISLTVAIQPLFLDEILLTSFEQSGNINAHIVVTTQIFSLAMVLFHFARKKGHHHPVPLLFYGFSVASLGTLLIPFSDHIGLILGFQGLVFYYVMRTLISAGTDTIQLQLSTLGGEVAALTRSPALLGKMVFMMLLGSAVLTGTFMQMAESVENLQRFLLIPVLATLGGALLVKWQLPERISTSKSGQDTFRRVWDLVTSDPRLQLCFASSFFVRADLVVVSLFLSLWCISIADVVGVTRDHALGQAGLLLGVMGVAALCALPVWRRVLARSSRIGALGISLLISSIGFLLLGKINNPFSWSVLAPMILIGIGQAGCLITPKVLATDLAPQDLIGPVQGMFHVVSSIGVILLVQSGGYYFDAVGPGSPFILLGSAMQFVMIYALWLMINGQDENAQHQLHAAHKMDLKPLIFMMSLLPLIWLVGRVLISGYVPGNSLGEMPVGFINRYLGDWAFNFLLLSLALRPTYELTGVRKLAIYSRMIGLYAYFYALLHVLSYVWLEWVFSWPEIFEDVHERRFVLLGAAAFVLLTALAATSNNKSIRAMGGRRWKQLQRFSYAIDILVAFHFILAATHENGEPYLYATLVLLLLSYRVRQSLAKRAAMPHPR